MPDQVQDKGGTKGASPYELGASKPVTVAGPAKVAQPKDKVLSPKSISSKDSKL